MTQKNQYDAVIIGSGPNGFSAAIELARAGLKVKIIEAHDTPGGGVRSKELTLPGFIHDVCSTTHPLAIDSPFFKKLPLEKFGLEWLKSPASLAHPFEDGSAVLLYKSIENSAETLGVDKEKYINLINPLSKLWKEISSDMLGPLKIPKHPFKSLRFGLNAILSAKYFIEKNFSGKKAKTLFAGLAAHSIVPLNQPLTAAAGLVLLLCAHDKEWAFPKGGAQQLTNALQDYFISLGGEVELNNEIRKYSDLPSAKFYLFDVTPQQLIKICGEKLPKKYIKKLQRFRYGPGVFKIDYALSEPIPFKSGECKKAATIHLGGSDLEIIDSEYKCHNNKHSEKPYLILAQHTLFDKTRAPENKHTAWVYCHVPNGSDFDMTKRIEDQIERFAPGFKDIVLSKNTMNSKDFQIYNSNYIGGDINGGKQDWKQFFSRPVLSFSPYKTPNEKILICSSSTPPGGGVHGMCGYFAAKVLMKKLHM